MHHTRRIGLAYFFILGNLAITVAVHINGGTLDQPVIHHRLERLQARGRLTSTHRRADRTRTPHAGSQRQTTSGQGIHAVERGQGKFMRRCLAPPACAGTLFTTVGHDGSGRPVAYEVGTRACGAQLCQLNRGTTHFHPCEIFVRHGHQFLLLCIRQLLERACFIRRRARLARHRQRSATVACPVTCQLLPRAAITRPVGTETLRLRAFLGHGSRIGRRDIRIDGTHTKASSNNRHTPGEVL